LCAASARAATNKPAIDRPVPVDCHQRLAMAGFLRTIAFDNLGLILDSTRFTKPKVHAEVR
jgi:hypothetical protein